MLGGTGCCWEQRALVRSAGRWWGAQAGMHSKGRDLRGGPSGGQTGGWRRLPKRLGAVIVGYKCHRSRHLALGRQRLRVGWVPWRGRGGKTSPPSNASLGTG